MRSGPEGNVAGAGEVPASGGEFETLIATTPENSAPAASVGLAAPSSAGVSTRLNCAWSWISVKVSSSEGKASTVGPAFLITTLSRYASAASLLKEELSITTD